MDYQKFLSSLSPTSNSSDESDVQFNLQEDDFAKIQERTNQQLDSNFLQLLTIGVKFLEEGELYCEVNGNSVASLVTILLDNPEIMAYFICENEENFATLAECVNKFNLDDRICSYEGNCQDFCQELQELESDDKIGIFYYNDSTDYRSLLISLMSIRSFLADEALIIISQANHKEIKEAITDFKSFHNSQQIQELLTLNTNQNSPENTEHDLVILLWRDNLEKLRAKKINQQGLIKLNQAQNNQRKILLHVGCGAYRKDGLPDDFRTPDWQEIRLDIDTRVQPDIIGTITDLTAVPDDSVDAIYSSHNLEHIYNFEVPNALAEFKRVLKPKGFIMLRVPDMQTAAESVAKGNIEETLYESPAGPISALWMFYGLVTSHEMPYMTHKTGFTVNNLQEKLQKAGFNNLKLIRLSFEILAYAYK